MTTSVRYNVIKLFLAAAISLVGGLTSYIALQFPGVIGIDDANITQVYARNIARGAGFVYQVGGERVEGSTSFLWTLLNSAAFLISSKPELVILTTSFLLAMCSTYFALHILFALAQSFRISLRTAGSVGVVFFLGTPIFYSWSIWTLMDVCLWAASFLWLVSLLASRFTEPSISNLRFSIMTSFAGVILVLTRPEGIAVCLGLIIVSILLESRTGMIKTRYPSYLFAMFSSIVAFAALTIFRIIYFGFPFPNTFYAKISSDISANLFQGARYVRSFTVEIPFMSFHIIVWILLAFFAIIWWASRKHRAAAEPSLIIAAAVFGVIFIYCFLGGDHFGLFRFFQPIMLLLPISSAMLLVWIMENVTYERKNHGAICAASVIITSVFVFGVGVAYLALNAKGSLDKEFRIANSGRLAGEVLSRFSSETTAFSIGVVAAGGIALTFDGKIYDLMGLNWVEMAHANRIKTGVRNHGGFEKSVFWKAKPDFINPSISQENESTLWIVSYFDNTALKGIFFDKEFQESYVPVVFRTQYGNIKAFVSHDWLLKSGQKPDVLISWDYVVLSEERGEWD